MAVRRRSKSPQRKLEHHTGRTVEYKSGGNNQKMDTPKIQMTKKEIEKWIEIIGEDWQDFGLIWSTKRDGILYDTKQAAIKAWLARPFCQ